MKMSSIDYDKLGLTCFASQFGKDVLERTKTAPTDEAVTDSLVRTAGLRHIPPHQAAGDHVNNHRHNPLMIDPAHPM
jgi:hypothetical protein